ncbi:Membrane protein involved in the export of O-antigen and teichoic acid [Haloarchaeobius iranensis]|uniref:Membrane protein involved in the export of O-antigen and teichoic acid n=2 Tax=Haloarchaeobius iranensis TaxID=996166 RepID=A0A1H0BCJ7_9EURY|nr:Membrane protein involved in the export of O-antigen and teichoic acid [Haloarchaeobius iranensis]
MGAFFLFQALLGILEIGADFGIRGAVEKRVSEGDSPGSFLSSAIVIKMVPIAVIVLIIFLLRSYVNDYLGTELALLLAIAIVLQEAEQLAEFNLKGELRVGETAELRVARQIVWAGVGIILVQLGYGAIGLVYGLMAGMGVVFVWGWYKTSTPFGRPSYKHARSLFDYAKYNVASFVGGYVYSWMDVLIIGFFLTQAHVGAYEVAWRITLIVMLLSRSIAEVLLPQISRWDSEDAKNRIESAISNAITPSMIFVIPSVFGVIVFSQEILEYMFGAEFTIAWLALIILMSEKLVQAIHVILGRALKGINRPDLAAYATIVSVVANLILNVALVVEFGIVGAAAATLLSFVLNTALHGYYLSKFVSIRFPKVEIGWCFLSAVGMTIALFGLQSVFDVDGLPSLLTAIFAGATVYVLFILSFRGLRMKFVTQVTSFVSNL